MTTSDDIMAPMEGMKSFIFAHCIVEMETWEEDGGERLKLVSSISALKKFHASLDPLRTATQGGDLSKLDPLYVEFTNTIIQKMDAVTDFPEEVKLYWDATPHEGRLEIIADLMWHSAKFMFFKVQAKEKASK